MENAAKLLLVLGFTFLTANLSLAETTLSCTGDGSKVIDQSSLLLNMKTVDVSDGFLIMGYADGRTVRMIKLTAADLRNHAVVSEMLTDSDGLYHSTYTLSLDERTGVWTINEARIPTNDPNEFLSNIPLTLTCKAQE